MPVPIRQALDLRTGDGGKGGFALKYDMLVDTPNMATANGKLLARVPKNSTVLELGCATGYMTKYMKENLECAVDVVEIDRESLAIASAYAEDSFEGDLEQTAWFEHYQEKRYDCVLIANVLEHIRNPLEVLQKARTLLKPSGKLLIAVPNVAHSDVILNLLHDDWHYTELGLLDNTHVYFYGRDNVIAMLEAAGFSVKEEDDVYLSMLETEQMPPIDGVPDAVVEYLRARPRGDVYQFVFEAVTGTVQQMHVVENKGERLMSQQDYIRQMEDEIEKKQKYIDQLEKKAAAFHEEAEAYARKLEADLAEAKGYIGKLEGQLAAQHRESEAYSGKLETDLSEAQGYIGKLEGQMTEQHRESEAYAGKLETDLTEAKGYIDELTDRMAAQHRESEAYAGKLEADIREVREYSEELSEKLVHQEEISRKMETENSDLQKKCYTQLQSLQQAQMELEGLRTELNGLQKKYQAISESIVWKIGGPIQKGIDAIAGKKDE